VKDRNKLFVFAVAVKRELRPGELLSCTIMKHTSTMSVGSWRVSLQSVFTLVLFSTYAAHLTVD
jgi:hypothetical protein